MNPTERRYDIDWLRVIAIGLLLLYHIAIIFQPWAMFIGFVRSDELWEDLWKPMTLLNIWRIPLLFFVSGMGCYFALKKRSAGQLIGERTRRILLPFAFGIVAITPLHMFLFQEYYNLPLGYYPHMGHLWFLGNIFAYVVLLLPLFLLLKRFEHSEFQKQFSKLMSSIAGPLIIAGLMVLEALLMKPGLYALYAETWHGFYLGLVAFFCGFLMVYAGAPFWNMLRRFFPVFLLIAAALFGLRYLEYKGEAPGYLAAVESASWILALFGVGYRFLNQPSSLLRYLTKAVYPVYIVHMFVLYAAARFILPLEFSAPIKFALISGITFVVCFVLYECIRRIQILRPLFGMNWKTSKTIIHENI